MALEWEVLGEEPLGDAPAATPVDFPSVIRAAEASPTGVSPKGAATPMQVMPGTALDPGFGVEPAANDSPEEVERVGVDYAKAMLNRYGSPALAGAAYNAGPGQLDQWLAKLGDPRKGEISEADFLRQIPFPETNAYVQRVAALAQSGAPGQWEVLGEQPLTGNETPVVAPSGNWEVLGEAPLTPVAGAQTAKPKGPVGAGLLPGVAELTALVAQTPNELPNPQAPQESWLQALPKQLRVGIGSALQTLVGPLQHALEQPAMPDIPMSEAELEEPDFMKQARQTQIEHGPLQQLSKAINDDMQANTANVRPFSVSGVTGQVIASAPQMIASALLTYATRNPMVGAAGIGVMTGGQEYSQERAEGISPDKARLGAAVNGFSESLGEEIPLGIMMAPGKKFLANTLKAAGAEGIQEALTQIIQTGYDMGVLHPDMTWGQAWASVVQAGIVGAVMGGGITAAAHPFVGKEEHAPAAAPPPPAAAPAAPAAAPPPAQPAPGAPPAAPPAQAAQAQPAAAPPAQPPPVEAEPQRKGPAPEPEWVKKWTEQAEKPKGKDWVPLYDETGANQVGWGNTETGQKRIINEETGEFETIEPKKTTPAAIAQEHDLEVARVAREATEAALPKQAQEPEETEAAPEEEMPAAPPTVLEGWDSSIFKARETAKALGIATEGKQLKPLAAEVKAALDERGIVAQPMKRATPEQIDADVSEILKLRREGRLEEAQDVFEALSQGKANPDYGMKLNTALQRAVAKEPPPPEEVPEGTRAAPVIEPKTDEDLEAARAAVDTDATDAQRAALNHQQAHVQMHGLDITMQVPKGQERVGPIDKETGEPTFRSVNPLADYGHIKRTEGADKSPVDVLIGHNPASTKAFIIDQYDPKTGKFNEHKPVIAVDTAEEALAAYDAQFSDGSGPSRRPNGGLEMSIENFKRWLKEGDTKKAILPQAVKAKEEKPTVSRETPPLTPEQARVKEDVDRLLKIYDEKGPDAANARFKELAGREHVRAVKEAFSDAMLDRKFTASKPGERALDDHKNPVFKQGERVIIRDEGEYQGRHGVISERHAMTMRPIYGGGPSETSFSYIIKTDQGAETYASKFEDETGPAPEVAPDIETAKGRHDTPQAVQRHIINAKESASKARAASHRAIKPERKRALLREAEGHDRDAASSQQMLDAWKAKHPEEAERIFGKPKPAAEKPSAPAGEEGPVTGVTVTENEGKDGVEIKFAGRPSEATLYQLKAAGFRWSKFQKLWYAKRTPKTLATARGLKAGVAEPEAAPAPGTALAPKLFVEIGTKRYPVDSLQDASEKVRATIEEMDIGNSEYPGALIKDGGGKLIGYVAYNGRIFEGHPQDWKPGTKLLYETPDRTPTEQPKPKSMLENNRNNFREKLELHGVANYGGTRYVISSDMFQGGFRYLVKRGDRVLGFGPDTKWSKAKAIDMAVEDAFPAAEAPSGPNLKAPIDPEAIQALRREYPNAKDPVINEQGLREGPRESLNFLWGWDRARAGVARGGMGAAGESLGFDAYHRVHPQAMDRNAFIKALEQTGAAQREGMWRIVPDVGSGYAVELTRSGKRYTYRAPQDRDPWTLDEAREHAVANAFGTAIPAKEKPIAKGARDWTEIGKNAIGQTLYEDQRGVRSILQPSGIRTSEPVGMVPTREGVKITTDRKANPEYALDSEPEAEIIRERDRRLAEQRKAKAEPSALTTEEQARYEALQARLKAKLKGQASAGLDPEIIQIGVEMTVLNIKAGVRRFAAIARKVASDLDVSLKALRPYLRSWYYGALDEMEQSGADVTGMDDDAAIRAGLAEIDAAIKAEEDGVPGPLPTSAPGERPAGLQPTPAKRPVGGAPETEDGGGVPAPRPAAGRPAEGQKRPSEGHPGPTVGGGTGLGVTPGVPNPGVRGPAAGQRPEDADVRGTDYRIEPGEIAEERGPKAKALDNLAAIRLVKQLQQEGRLKAATRAEQTVLAKYVGWGGLRGAFKGSDDKYGEGYESVGKELEDLLTKEEYRTAVRSSQYAHYTAEHVIRSMWDAVRRMGFGGGSVFEPGMGIGHFVGMMPPDIAAASQYQGIEMDHLTADIATALYPQSGVRQADYTLTPIPDNTFDLVIGNPPFADTVIKADPKYAPRNFMLHDYFFAKSMDALRPGGIMAFVTSAGTMNKLETSARSYLGERAQFLGGVRLPSTAFKKNAGTEVTTDILFFQKRQEPLAPGEFDRRHGQSDPDTDWLTTVHRELPNAEGGTTKGNVNRWFSNHPEMVLGEEGFFDKLYKGRYAVHERKGEDLETALAKALTNLPENIYIRPDSAQMKAEQDFASNQVKDGSFYLRDGKVWQYSGGAGEQVMLRGRTAPKGMPAGDYERVTHLIPVRDALRDVYRADLAENEKDAKAARKALNKAYDTFVEKFGPINKATFEYRRPSRVQEEVARAQAHEEARARGEAWDVGEFDAGPYIAQRAVEDIEEEDAETGEKKKVKAKGPTWAQIAKMRQEARDRAQAGGRKFDEGSFNPEDMPDVVIEKRPNVKAFMDDPESYRLRAIEEYNEQNGEAKKRRVFTESVLTRETEPDIKSANDGVMWSLNKFGRLDLDAIARKRNQTKDQIVAELGDAVYRLPGTNDTYQTADEYLSGDVLDKLAEAKKYAEIDPQYQRNADALEAAKPQPLPPAQIHMAFGMPWIPGNLVEDFARDIGIGRANINHSDALGGWTVEMGEHGGEWERWSAGGELDASQVMREALNRTKPRIYRWEGYGPDRERVFDPIATQQVADKIDELSSAFAQYDKRTNELLGGWVMDNDERYQALADLYNDKMNRTVPRVFDGSFLTTPGVASDWKWRPHQRRVVARIILSGNTYTAHAVGAGKTSEYIGAGMEMRRLGLVKKPMYVVPNIMLAQFTKEFYEQYPLAKIAVADERRFHTSRRKQFIANVAQEDLDAIILTHSAFGKIPLSPNSIADFIQEEIDLIDEALSDLDEQDDRVTVRKLENKKEKLEQRLRGALAGRRDQTFTFEEMGVDFLFVDEAHQFRKLDFASRQNIKGIDGEGSDRAFDLYAKLRYLDSKSPGRSVVMGSGTPVTNTMGELYTLSKYMQREALQKRGIWHFDSWAASFGDVETATEPTAQGTYERVTRFRKFVNGYELYKMVSEVMDIVTSQQLEQYVVRPKIKGGARKTHLAPKTDAYERFQATLVARVEAIKQRRGPPSKGDDILLSVINDGRHAAIDMRFIEPGPANQDSKLNMMIGNVFDIWKRTKNTQFFDPATNYTKEISHGPATQMVFSNLGVNPRGPIGFSGYRWIKQELVKRGIPANEVAFIGDYKSHIARQKLFNDMNAGKVRVLVGSTTKMGMGVNAQRRLLALHNLDPLWYPADDEQRIGRGLRQGNWNPELEIHDYSTKGTYDEQMWKLMASKARFIEQFFRGDPTLRTIDDVGEASFYEQASAMAAADERIILLTEMQSDLDRLERQRAGHEREQYGYRQKISSAKRDIEHADETIPRLQKEIAKRKPMSGDDFSMKIGDETYEKFSEAADALAKTLEEVVPKLPKEVKRPLFEIGGFRVQIEKYGKTGFNLFVLMSNGEPEYVSTSASTGAGVIDAIRDKLSSFESRIENQERYKAEGKKQIAALTPLVGKPFAKEKELAELRVSVARLEHQIVPPNRPTSTVADVDRALMMNVDDFRRGIIDKEEFDRGRDRLQKRKDELEGKAKPLGEAEQAQTPPAAPPFYSALTRAIEESTQKKASAGQWQATIRNAKGIKQDEIDWSGVKEWIAGHGDKPITKEDLVNFLKASEPDIKEVMLKSKDAAADDGADLSVMQHARYRELSAKGVANLTPAELKLFDWLDGHPDATDLEYLTREYDIWISEQGLQMQSADELLMDLNAEAMDVKRGGGTVDPKVEAQIKYLADFGERWTEAQGEEHFAGRDETKFGSFQLPGGKNYREFFLTWPETPVKMVTDVKYEDFLKRAPKLAKDFEESLFAYAGRRLKKNDLEVELNNALYGGGWGAQTDETAAIRDLYPEIVKEGEQQRAAQAKNWRDGHRAYDHIANPIIRVRFNDRITASGKKMLFIEEMQEPHKGQPMPSLLRKMAYEIGVKRMIRYAAENGYDEIGITPGQVQAERYDLSKHLKSVSVVPKVQPFGDNKIVYHVNARTIDDRPYSLGGLFADELPDAVGKELAEKIIKDTTPNVKTVYEGLDLKVGGEDLKQRYDKAIVGIANKYGKKWGAQVGEATTWVGANEPDRYGVYKKGEMWAVKDGQHGNVVRQFATKERAQEHAAKWNEEEKKNNYKSVHVLPITEAMRDSVMQGQPLFKRPWSEVETAPGEAKEPLQRIKGATLYGEPLGALSAKEKELVANVERIIKGLAPAAEVTPMRNLRIGERSKLFGAVYQNMGQRMIAWALDAPDPFATGRHEVVHWLRAQGYITDPEWAALEKAARAGNWIKKHNIKARYPNLSESEQLEEAIADEFGEWRPERPRVEPRIKTAFQRIAAALQRIKAVAQRIFGPKVTYQDVFGRIESGEVGEREPVKGRRVGTTQFARAASINSAAFRKWFGKSKVVDGNGKPLVVYHGTKSKPFTKFMPSKGKTFVWGREFTVDRPVSFFTSDQEFAHEFGETIIPAYLSLQNPIDLTEGVWGAPGEQGAKALELFKGVFGEHAGFVKPEELWEFFDSIDNVNALKEIGYDGAILSERRADNESADVWVAFEPTQIKSPANRGSFRPTSPDIMAQRPKISTLSDAFKRWFGKSKVVNADGTPKVVYHGTDVSFDKFERSEDIGFHFGTASAANARVKEVKGWDPEARQIGRLPPEGENLIPVYLKIENPLRVKDLFTWDPEAVLDELIARGILPADFDTHEPVDRDFVRDALAKKGYDGIVYRNAVEGKRRLAKGENVPLTVVPNEWLGKGAGPEKAYLANTEDGGTIGMGRTPEAAKADAIKYLRRGNRMPDDSYIVFNANQIKSVFNQGTFNPEDDRIMASVPQVPATPPPTFDDPASEQRWQDARKGAGAGQNIITQAKDWLDYVRAGITQHWINLPNVPKYANLQQQLHKLEAAPEAANEEIIRALRKIVGKLTPEDLDLFTRKVVLDDLSYEVDQEHDLPFGLTDIDVPRELAKVDAAIAARPDIAARVRERKAFTDRIKQALVDNGVLDAKRVKNPAYYRHQVLEYARTMASGATSGAKKLRTPKWAKRMGSSKDINANYLEAEFDWLRKALNDIAAAKAIEWIKESPHNIRERVVSAAKASNQRLVDSALAADQQARGYMKGGKLTSPMTEQWTKFRQRIAMGLENVRQALEGGALVPPPWYEDAADAIQNGTRDDSVLPFLSWILDNDEPGSMGAATAFKAIAGRKRWVQDLLGRNYADPTDIKDLIKRGLAPDGYTTWQPDEGKLLFTAKTIPEHALQSFLSALAEKTPEQAAAELGLPLNVSKGTLGARLAEELVGASRDILAVGGDRYTMVIPQEVADTLNSLRNVPEQGIFDAVVRAPLRLWKQWVLINPMRVLKYNLNNLSGDLDAIVAGAPRVVKMLPKATKELGDVMVRGKEPTTEYKDAVERGVFNAGITIQEVPDVNSLSEFEHLMAKDRTVVGKALRPFGATWRFLRKYTTFRENMLRYAAYLDYLNRLNAGEPMSKIGYGASNPEMVDAVTDNKDKAALLARDLVGDYGAVSHFGQSLRRTVIPFWSWTEINTKRYWRLSNNSWNQGVGKGFATAGLLGASLGLRTTAYLALRMFAMFALIALWNRLMWGDDEDKLDPEQARQLHILLGHDSNGEIRSLRVQGAVSDALSWIGFLDAMGAMSEVGKGRGSVWDILAAVAKAPVKKLAGGITPVISVPVEFASGQSYFPDVFNPIPVRDKWREAFRLFSLDPAYDAVMGKPTRGIGHTAAGALIYQRDPGEIAYDQIRGMTFDWLAKTKGESGVGSATTARGEALREWRTAARYGDKRAARVAFEKMKALGINRQSANRSLAAAAPLGSLSLADRRAFFATLTPQEQDRVKDAEKWYKDTLVQGAAEATRMLPEGEEQ